MRIWDRPFPRKTLGTKPGAPEPWSPFPTKWSPWDQNGPPLPFLESNFRIGRYISAVESVPHLSASGGERTSVAIFGVRFVTNGWVREESEATTLTCHSAPWPAARAGLMRNPSQSSQYEIIVFLLMALMDSRIRGNDRYVGWSDH
jgi:hypothetical protein